MSRVRFHRQALEEFRSQYEWYEQQQPGIGKHFSQELRRAVAAIEGIPEGWPEIRPGIRSRRLHKFPHSILYGIEEDGTVYVYAVMHQRRLPGYWLDRQ